VLDQPGWHTGGELTVPEGIHLEYLPAYSPELQPAERLWPLCNEGVANRLFATIQELEEAVAHPRVAAPRERGARPGLLPLVASERLSNA
jgi:transposase